MTLLVTRLRGADTGHHCAYVHLVGSSIGIKMRPTVSVTFFQNISTALVAHWVTNGTLEGVNKMSF